MQAEGEHTQKRRRKRWRWTKRIYAALLVFFVASVAARIWWGWYADKKLQEAKQTILARGDKLEFRDLAPPHVPDELNAALLYKKAAAIPLLTAESDEPYRDFSKVTSGELVRPEELPMVYPPKTTPEEKELYRLREMISDLVGSPAFRREHKKELQEIVEHSKEALALCRKARALTQNNWDIDFSGPAINVLIPELGGIYPLARLLCLNALAAHEAGEDGQAVECIRDVLALGDSVDTMPFLITHVAAQGADDLATSAIEEMAPNLKMGDLSGAAGREQVKALVAQLLDDSLRRKGFVCAFTAERSFEYDTLERFRRFEIGTRDVAGPRSVDPRRYVGTWLFGLVTGPMWKLDEARILRHMDAYVAAAGAGSYPAFVKARHQAYPEGEEVIRELRDMGLIRSFTRMLSLVLMPGLERLAVLHFRSIASSRMAATALAMRLYEIDNGRRPEKLDDLVGKYIPGVPADPFTEDHAIRYLHRQAQALLYSVNENGTDDGGKFDASADWVFFLNGDRPEKKREPPFECSKWPPDEPASSTTRSSEPTSGPPAAPTLSE